MRYEAVNERFGGGPAMRAAEAGGAWEGVYPGKICGSRNITTLSEVSAPRSYSLGV
jgi:hypothetical protein